MQQRKLSYFRDRTRLHPPPQPPIHTLVLHTEFNLDSAGPHLAHVPPTEVDGSRHRSPRDGTCPLLDPGRLVGVDAGLLAPCHLTEVDAWSFLQPILRNACLSIRLLNLAPPPVLHR